RPQGNGARRCWTRQELLLWQCRRAELRVLRPIGDASIFKRAVWFPDHGHCANPFALVEALAGAFLRNGGQILARRVLDLEFHADGANTVVTDAGPMPVETLLVAAGAWSHRLASKLGHTVPLEMQRGYHALLADPNTSPRRNVQWSERKFIATPMETGL